MSKQSKGFTLIELIVVLVLLGLIAAVAVPKYLDMTSKARENSLKANLSAIRGAIELSYSQSVLQNSPSPGAYPATVAALASVIKGGVIPSDVFTPTNDVKIVTGNIVDPGSFNDNGGWIYSTTTGEIRADLAGYHTL